MVQQELDRLGKQTAGQRNVLIAFGVTILLWIAPGVMAIAGADDTAFARGYAEHMPEGVAAMIGACLLFVLPVNWRGAPVHALLGRGREDRLGHHAAVWRRAGAGRDDVCDRPGASHWRRRHGLAAVAIAAGPDGSLHRAAIVVSEAASNTASANMIIPIAIAVSQAAGVRPIEPVLGATLGASMGFMMPVSTAPNVIVYSSGHVPIGR